MTNKFAIETLVEDRCRALGLNDLDLIRRCGYRNASKGLRRLAELRKADWQAARGLIETLPGVLGISPEAIRETMAKTDAQIRATEDAAWRAAFKPHAIILTEHSRPTKITLAAITGVDQWLRIDFAEGILPLEYIRLAVKEIPRRTGMIQFFYGLPIGVVVNYSPDYAVRFHLAGASLEVLPKAYRLGHSAVFVSGREVTQTMQTLLFPDLKAHE